MYNQEIKNEYLQQAKTEATISNSKALFKITSDYEHLVETDLYDLDYEKIAELIVKSNLKDFSFEVFERMLRYTKKYKKWALVMNYVNEKDLVFQKIDRKRAYRKAANNIFFESPKDLVENLSPYFGKREDDFIVPNELFLGYTMLLYQGFNVDDALNLRVENVEIVRNHMIIFNGDQDVIVYEEFKDTLARIYNIRKCLITSNYNKGVYPMGEYLIGDGIHDPQGMKMKMARYFHSKAAANKGWPLNFKIREIYYMGKVYLLKQKQLDASSIDIEDIRKYCFNGKKDVVSSQLKIVLNLFQIWS